MPDAKNVQDSTNVKRCVCSKNFKDLAIGEIHNDERCISGATSLFSAVTSKVIFDFSRA